MGQLTRSQLKALYETGDVLLQSSFIDFIDSVFNIQDDVMAGATGPTGPTGPIGPTGSIENTPANYADFIDQGGTAPPYSSGRFYYSEGVFYVYTDIDGPLLQVGQDLWINARNISGSTIPKGSVVYISGAIGQRPTIELASNTSHDTSHVIGITSHNIDHNRNGYVILYGRISGVDTDLYTDGDELYLGATAGTYTNVKPTAPTHTVKLGTVVVAANNGSILISISDSIDLNDLTEVLISNPKDKDRLAYNASTQRWENAEPQDLPYIGATQSGTLPDENLRIFVNHSGPITLTGPVSRSINKVYEIIDTTGNASSNNITFDCNGYTIRGLSSKIMNSDWEVLKVVFDGTNYQII